MRFDLQDDDPIEVQMTPLIDCVFLLLVFFLVATTMKRIEPELPIQLPRAAVGVVMTTQPPERMVIAIDMQGTAFIDGQPVGSGTLLSKLEAYAQREPGSDAAPPKVRLDIDRGAPFQNVVEVVDLCSSLGIRDVSFHTDSDQAQ